MKKREQIPFFLICTFSLQIFSAAAVLISSPFDNFRIECPQMSATQRLGIRMIESQGMKRQDAVYSISCNHIDEIYPWVDMPTEVQDIDREDCRYSPPFDPIIDTYVNHTCRSREYLTGIARLSDTRIQVECCRMRSRDESTCSEKIFSKPFGFNYKTEIELNGQLINSIAIGGDNIHVRFCDLSPRKLEDIRNDVAIQRGSPWQTTTEPTTTIIETTTSTEPPTTTESHFLPPKKVIKISKKTVLSDKGNWSTDTPWESKTETTTVTALTSTTAQFTTKQIQTFENQSSTINSQPVLVNNNTKEDTLTTKPETTQQKVAPLVIDSTNEASVTQERQETENRENVPSKNELLKQKPQKHLNDGQEVQPENSNHNQDSGNPGSLEETGPLRDLENVEDATKRLIKTISEMMQAEKDAMNLIKRVKAAGLPQQVSEKNEDKQQQPLKELEDSVEEDDNGPQSSERHEIESFLQVTEEAKTTTKEQPTTTEQIASVFKAVETESNNKNSNDNTEVSSSQNSDEDNAPPAVTSKPIQAYTKFKTVNNNNKNEAIVEDITLAPFAAFPSPPSSNSGKETPRHLPQWYKSDTTTPSPRRKQVVDNSDESQDGGDESAENEETTKPTTTVTTQLSPRTRYHRLKYLDSLSTFEGEFVATTQVSRRRTRTRRPTTIGITQKISPSTHKPYVDEETSDSPFDRQFSQNSHYRQQQQNLAIAAAVAASRERLDDDEVAENRQPDEEEQTVRNTAIEIDVLGGGSIGATSSASNGRGNKPENHFDKQSPFDTADIRRAPRPRISYEEPYNEVQQQLIERKRRRKQKNGHSITQLVNEDIVTAPPETTTETTEDVVQLNNRSGRSQRYYQAERFETSVDEYPVHTQSDVAQSLQHKKQRDGSKSFEPYGNKPVEMPVINNLVPMGQTSKKIQDVERTINSPSVTQLSPSPVIQTSESAKQQRTNLVEQTPKNNQPEQDVRVERKTSNEKPIIDVDPQEQEIPNEEYTDKTTTILTPSSPTYNPASFYFVPRHRHREREIAIRDSNNLIIACGSDSEVWQPNRCPQSTDCFTAQDSTYRICCPVSSN